MNKKLAMLMFAIGVGAASASAWADSCASHCYAARRSCDVHPELYIGDCLENFVACMTDCGLT